MSTPCCPAACASGIAAPCCLIGPTGPTGAPSLAPLVAFTVGLFNPDVVLIGVTPEKIIFTQALAGTPFPSYNLFTGIFTVPAKGIYMFSITAAAAFSGNENVTVSLVKNSAPPMGASSSATIAGQKGQIVSTAWNVTLDLMQNDSLFVQISCTAIASATLPPALFPALFQSLSVQSLF